MNRFIVVGTGKDYVTAIWNDVKNDADVIFFESPFLKRSYISDFLCKAHSAFIINRYVRLPMHRIWKSHYSIHEIMIEDDDMYFFYFYDNSLCRYDPKYIRNLKREHSNIKYVLSLGNAMYKRESLLKPYLADIDIVYTSNKDDAEKYGFKYRFKPTLTINGSNPKKPSECKYDVFYVGNAYDRLDKIHAVFSRLKSLGLTPCFYVSGVKPGDCTEDDIHYNVALSYDQVLEGDCNSKCILEIVGNRPTMMTMRTLEALKLNRCLITNNPNVLNETFYNPEYVLFFEKAEDITQAFFSMGKTPSYSYKESTIRDILMDVVADLNK